MNKELRKEVREKIKKARERYYGDPEADFKIREKINKARKIYYKNHKDVFKRCVKRYRQKPKVKVRLKEYRKKYLQENKDRICITIKKCTIKKKYDLTLKEYSKITKECMIMGCKENTKGIIELHHINHNKKDNRKENFIGLCCNCHQKIHRLKYKIKATEMGYILENRKLFKGSSISSLYRG